MVAEAVSSINTLRLCRATSPLHLGDAPDVSILAVLFQQTSLSKFQMVIRTGMWQPLCKAIMHACDECSFLPGVIDE